MIKSHQLLFALVLSATGLAANSLSAKAATIVPQTTLTDTDFQQLITTGKFTESFVAQSRIGNNATNGTQEIDLLNPQNNLLPVDQKQRKWNSGQAIDFSLEYDGSLVKYIVGNQIVSSNVFSGAVSDIFFRTRAAANSSLLLSNLAFSDAKSKNLAITDVLSSGAASSDVDYLQLSKISGAFKLTGKSTMTWTGTNPTNSNLAYQLKVGTTPIQKKVPEPGTIAAIMLTGLAIAGSKKKAKIVG
ncbi:choice-of-anchor W domain-containing protein [Phormidesmis priestleyi]